MSFAIACMSGSFKGVFVHGVLHALEEAGLRADAYAAASSSTLVSAYAATGAVHMVGTSIWADGEQVLATPGGTMSDAVLLIIRRLAPHLEEALFKPEAARMLVAASLVTTGQGAAITQGSGARRLGRRLLVDAARGDSTWRDLHLTQHLFDTRATDPEFRLDARNFRQVAYATTRMLHAWPIPAEVNGKPYVDASYTCLCPAVELAALGYRDVLAIATETGPVRRDMFGEGAIPSAFNGSRIRIVQPDTDLRKLGVDFASAAAEGLNRAFEHGIGKGRAFVEAGG